MDLSPRRRKWLIIDHLLIISGVIWTITIFGRSVDEITGRANVLDYMGFTGFLALCGFLALLPFFWRICKGTRLNSFLMPLFIFLTLSYLYVAFLSYFIQPGSTGCSVAAQLFVLVCLACRIG